jgi:hypothetical protein
MTPGLAVFVDRDGHLVEERRHLKHVSRARMLPRSAETIYRLRRARMSTKSAQAGLLS